MTTDADILASEAQWRAERDNARGTALQASTVGLVAMVDVGWSVWSKTRKDDRDDTIGGVVLEIQGAASYTDPVTGEIVDKARRYRVVDPYPGVRRWHWVDETDIDVDAIETPDPWRILVVTARMARDIVGYWQSDRRTLLGHEADIKRLVSDMSRLVGAVV